MEIDLKDESGLGCRSLRASDGLSIRALPDGSIYAIEHGPILINQVLASPVAGGVHRVYLRLHRGGGIESYELVGSGARGQFEAGDDRFVWSGSAGPCDYRCTCWVHPAGDGWFVHVEVHNRDPRSLRCDAILLQDLGLATRGQVRNNELFNSQYLDHFAVAHAPSGYLLMTRQNLPQPGETHPWLMQGCFPRAVGLTTDGLDFFGAEHRRDRRPAALARSIIGTRVRQSEVGHTAIQGAGVDLAAGAAHAWTFFAHYLPDHPERSSDADVQRLGRIGAMRADLNAALGAPAKLAALNSPPSLFNLAAPFLADDLEEREIQELFPAPRRHEELIDGRLGSFFRGEPSRHVVLQAKERSAMRPHGHILRAGDGHTPDAEVISCTCYASGVLASQLTLGNTSLAKLLSGVRDPLNLVRSSGLRLFVRHDSRDEWRLLQVPSAFEMSLDACRWIYKRGPDRITITCSASESEPSIRLDVRSGSRPAELLICGEIAGGAAEYGSSPRMTVDPEHGRITIRPDAESLLGTKLPEMAFDVVACAPQAIAAMGGEELLSGDGERRGLPYFAIRTRPTSSFTFTIGGTLHEGTPRHPALGGEIMRKDALRDRMTVSSTNLRPRIAMDARVQLPNRQQGEQLQDALAWLARDAIVHLCVPRGLEQANGGAWGVRDVCQGPVEFLLAYDRGDLVADILRHVFAQQYARRADWPQWFMFPPFQEIQSSHCHGDNLIWPLKALCDYLEHANDASILHERVPYTEDHTFERTESAETILEHVDRLIEKMRAQMLSGVALPRYGEGDWDDSLQPADPSLRERMVSSWTAALMYQTLRRYAAALSHFGDGLRAADVEQLAQRIEADFQRHLMPDGVVGGFAVFDGQPPRPVEYLLHPSVTRTGLRYRLIPMTRGILSGIFTRAQAETHLELIRRHLLFPDGARLMDRPTTYQGGIQRTFRRSESAAFFGREIGLQYVHAHLRYAEALATMGRADELWRALQVVNPIAVTEVVSNARPRQRNCYFSSSDAAFPDRYQAARDYDQLRRGEVSVDGGWRIYSSGPGIYTSLVIRHLFGIRRRFGRIEIDPVLPRQLSGATLELPHDGRRVRFEFTMSGDAASPRQIQINDRPPPRCQPLINLSRNGGVGIAQELFNSMLTSDLNVVRAML